MARKVDLFAKNTKRGLWLRRGFYAILLSLYAVGYYRHNERTCNLFNLSLTENSELGFVQTSELEKILTSGGSQQFVGRPLSGIDLNDLEKLASKNPYIQKIQIFCLPSGELEVEVAQEKPIVRVSGFKGSDFYLTKEGKELPMHASYTARVMVIDAGGCNKYSFSDFENNEANKSLLNFCSYIEADAFWNKMLPSAWMNSEGDMFFTPQIGKQVIEFGGPEDYEIKLEKLQTFYSQIVPKKGWGYYHRVKLQYQNQIVCQHT